MLASSDGLRSLSQDQASLRVLDASVFDDAMPVFVGVNGRARGKRGEEGPKCLASRMT